MKIKRLPPERTTLEECEQQIACPKCPAGAGDPCRYFSGEKKGRIAARPHQLRLQLYGEMTRAMQDARMRNWMKKESDSAILSYRASQLEDYARVQDFLRQNIGLFLELASDPSATTPGSSTTGT